ncbi:unnamed protein product [Linum tenue]|uniref:Uncharacterized protein n=1 Tax=Linum tenue TaxID=586396 RepID=A0AAV0JBB0_9ROSI|nr:unnamed protein product [Linum tenue]
MPTFELTSDNEFIMASTDERTDVIVLQYSDDPTALEMIRPSPISGELTDGVRVGASPKAEYNALEVMGAVIKKRRLKELAKDLALPLLDGGFLPLLVNRRGLCLAADIDHPSVWRLRINDYFGWSKYGVIREVLDGGGVWNKCDMYNGAVVVDVEEAMSAVEEARELRVALKEKKRVIQDGRSELAVCRKEVECMREVVEKSNREVAMVKARLQAFKAGLRCLVDDDHQDGE